MIENRNDALSAIDKLKDYNYCFIRNRKLEERKTIDIQDFYEVFYFSFRKKKNSLKLLKFFVILRVLKEYSLFLI